MSVSVTISKLYLCIQIRFLSKIFFTISTKFAPLPNSLNQPSIVCSYSPNEIWQCKWNVTDKRYPHCKWRQNLTTIRLLKHCVIISHIQAVYLTTNEKDWMHYIYNDEHPSYVKQISYSLLNFKQCSYIYSCNLLAWDNMSFSAFKENVHAYSVKEILQLQVLSLLVMHRISNRLYRLLYLAFKKGNELYRNANINRL